MSALVGPSGCSYRFEAPGGPLRIPYEEWARRYEEINDLPFDGEQDDGTNLDFTSVGYILAMLKQDIGEAQSSERSEIIQ